MTVRSGADGSSSPALSPVVPPPPAAGPWRQLAAALWVRRTMQRRARWAQPGLLVATPLGLVGALLLGTRTSSRLPPVRVGELADLLPLGYLTFAVGALVAAVASAGGRELVPRAQLVAYPWSPVADHLGALLLAPLNLAWLLQGLGLAYLTGVLSPWGPGLVVTVGVAVGWMVACTAVAQLLAWVVELVRSTRFGVWWLRGVSVLAALVAARTLDAGALVGLLDRTPTAVVSRAAVDAASGAVRDGLLVTAGLAVATVVAAAGGARLKVVLDRRPGRDQVDRVGAVHAPRPLPDPARRGADVLAWRRTDWAAVRRSPPLRRGLVVLLVVPAIGAALSQVAWTDLPLLVAVVAAAAGMLFGVNVFSIDGAGATWRQTLPVRPRTWVLARLVVLTELVLLTGGVVLLAAAATADDRPTPTAVVAALLTLVTIPAQVVARCMRWSVSRPHRAELRVPRDSPAPPGAMTLYSAQLVLGASFMGLVLAVAARAPSPLWPLLVVLPSLALSALSLRRTLRRWDDPVERARVVAVVSAG